jgi:hypothetical protein
MLRSVMKIVSKLASTQSLPTIFRNFINKNEVLPNSKLKFLTRWKWVAIVEGEACSNNGPFSHDPFTFI